MNEKDIANKVKQHLNFGLSRIDPAVEKRLASARASALAAYAQREHAPGYVLAGATGGHVHHHFHWPLRYWLPVVLLIAALTGVLYWQSETAQNNDEDVDAHLLASDLPPTAYLDKGFAEWLDQHSPQP